ncbi:G patch domain-containing protein 8 [Cytospora mali]|uniref:G patch domain-containing protein 8 n=1 Tax=Cytospora mali TaxID=578113 RepID=A0A194URH6_CYTMA|nr:G patch domain-containing protein 8 [Valsa mali var. pyri (nom. inval.)]
MPPRHQTLPPAQTAAAREARQAFYCDLCQKGYSRHNEYEAHLSSYDHSHKVRLKEMRAMTRDPTAAARARKAEAKADGVISIQLGASGSGGSGDKPAGGGFKKGGFKKSGFKSAFGPAAGEDGEKDSKLKEEAVEEGKVKSLGLQRVGSHDVESDTDDEGYEMYDPRFPTD